MIIRLGIIYLFNLFDLIFTRYWVNKIGIDFELNPIGKWILSSPVLTIAFKVILVGALLILMYFMRVYKITKICSWILLGVFVALTVYHIVGSIIVQKFL